MTKIITFIILTLIFYSNLLAEEKQKIENTITYKKIQGSVTEGVMYCGKNKVVMKFIADEEKLSNREYQVGLAWINGVMVPEPPNDYNFHMNGELAQSNDSHWLGFYNYVIPEVRCIKTPNKKWIFSIGLYFFGGGNNRGSESGYTVDENLQIIEYEDFPREISEKRLQKFGYNNYKEYADDYWNTPYKLDIFKEYLSQSIKNKR